MTEEMDRVFGDTGLARGSAGDGLWSPAIEVSEREGNLCDSRGTAWIEAQGCEARGSRRLELALCIDEGCSVYLRKDYLLKVIAQRSTRLRWLVV
jgi:hypothetical protein